jgi:RimJ/RimL family protein N-acetyltransferase
MLYPNLVLETARLVIRPLDLPDLQTAHELLNASFGPASQDERLDWLLWTIASYTEQARLYQFPYGERAIALKRTGEMVGMVGFVPAYGPFGRLPGLRQVYGGNPALHLPAVGLFWVVADAHRRRGYATEAAQRLIDFAFEELALGVIVATTEYENHASISVMRRLNMHIEHNPDAEPAWFQVTGWLANPRSTG